MSDHWLMVHLAATGRRGHKSNAKMIHVVGRGAVEPFSEIGGCGPCGSRYIDGDLKDVEETCGRNGTFHKHFIR
jgi:hypothetical protein